MIEGIRSISPGLVSRAVTGLASVLVLSGLLLALGACEDLASDAPPAVDTSAGDVGATVPSTAAATSTVAVADVTAPVTAAGSATSTTAEEQIPATSAVTVDEHGTSVTYTAESSPPAPPEPSNSLLPFAGPPVTPFIDVADVFTRFEETDPRLEWVGIWNDWYRPVHHRYTAVYARVVVRFQGTRISYVAVTDKRCGIAKLTLDGRHLDASYVDLYSDTPGSETVWVSPVLASGTTHSLEIAWTGTKNAAATDYLLTFDAVEVAGTLVGL